MRPSSCSAEPVCAISDRSSEPFFTARLTPVESRAYQSTPAFELRPRHSPALEEQLARGIKDAELQGEVPGSQGALVLLEGVI